MLKNSLFQPSLSFSFSAAPSCFSVSALSVLFSVSALFWSAPYFFFSFLFSTTFLVSLNVLPYFFSPKLFSLQPKTFFSAQNLFQFSPKTFFSVQPTLLFQLLFLFVGSVFSASFSFSFLPAFLFCL